MSAKPPNSIDAYVGSRVRVQRMMLNISQEELAKHLGLTFQQVQKYERGTNRISASKLYDIALILNVPIDFFFSEGSQVYPDVKGAAGSELLRTYAYSREGFALNKAFMKIKHHKTRQAIIALAIAMAKKGKEQFTDIPCDSEINIPHRKS